MLRSLYSGVSGLKCNQNKMDVIGNNVANASTTAFKSGRMSFQDVFSQTLANAQGATEEAMGGVNPRQIGLGVSIGTIDTIMTGGSTQPTGRNLDFAITGEGFFIVSPDADGGSKLYTRDGIFYTDDEGNLVNGSGYRVLGYAVTGSAGNTVDVDTNGNGTDNYTVSDDSSDIVDTGDPDDLEALIIPSEINGNELEGFSIDGTGLVSAVYDGTTYYLGKVALAKFNNPEGLEKNGSNTYTQSNNSGDAQVGSAGTDGYGSIMQGFIEMSNVDLATELTDMIITSRAYQANSKTISTSNEMLQHLLNM